MVWYDGKPIKHMIWFLITSNWGSSISLPLMLAVILEKKTNNGTFIETVIGHYQPCINGSSGWSTNVVIWMVPFDVSLTISLSSNSFDLKVLKLALILERTNNGTFIETVTYSSFDIWCDWETVSFESMFWQTIQILWC